MFNKGALSKILPHPFPLSPALSNDYPRTLSRIRGGLFSKGTLSMNPCSLFSETRGRGLLSILKPLTREGVVNPFREPGLKKSWTTSKALFGSRRREAPDA